jgi:hypothetical protein
MAGLFAGIETSKIGGMYKTSTRKYEGLFGDDKDQLTEIDLVPRIKLQTGDTIVLLESIVDESGDILTGEWNGKPIPYMACQVLDARGRHVGYQVYNASILYAMPTVSYKDSRMYSPITRILSRNEQNAVVEKAVNTNKELVESVKKGMRFRITRIFSEWEKSSDKDAPRRYMWSQTL